MPPPLTEDREARAVTEVRVDSSLTCALKHHQREGVVFLYECVMGMKDPNYNGAILADEMGLGKTLQCITLIWTLLKKGPFGKPILKRVLIITPSSLCENWEKEFKRWLGTIKISPFVVGTNTNVKDFNRNQRDSVMIMSYEMLVKNFNDVAPFNFEMVVCDEAHRLKNKEVRAAKVREKQ